MVYRTISHPYPDENNLLSKFSAVQKIILYFADNFFVYCQTSVADDRKTKKKKTLEKVNKRIIKDEEMERLGKERTKVMA